MVQPNLNHSSLWTLCRRYFRHHGVKQQLNVLRLLWPDTEDFLLDGMWRSAGITGRWERDFAEHVGGVGVELRVFLRRVDVVGDADVGHDGECKTSHVAMSRYNHLRSCTHPWQQSQHIYIWNSQKLRKILRRYNDHRKFSFFFWGGGRGINTVRRTTTASLSHLFHHRTRGSYVYNGCLEWYNVVLTHGSTQAWNS